MRGETELLSARDFDVGGGHWSHVARAPPHANACEEKRSGVQSLATMGAPVLARFVREKWGFSVEHIDKYQQASRATIFPDSSFSI